MTEQFEPSLGDVQRCMALVRDVCERWDDPKAWREYLLNGLCMLVDGRMGTITAQELSERDQFGNAKPLAVVGLSPQMQASLFERAIATTNQQSTMDIDQIAPGMKTLFTQFQRAGWATSTRLGITDDLAYYASAHHRQFRKHAGVDDYIISIRSVDAPSRLEVLTVDRGFDQVRFGAREAKLLRLVHDEIAPLIGVRLTTEDHLSRDGLSRRLRETLTELLAGKSEKGIATQMGISQTTVHEYIGAIYKHFRVKTRAELMAYFVLRQPQSR